jgi:hypothetical protein
MTAAAVMMTRLMRKTRTMNLHDFDSFRAHQRIPFKHCIFAAFDTFGASGRSALPVTESNARQQCVHRVSPQVFIANFLSP